VKRSRRAGTRCAYVILRPPLATCIARAAGRAGDALSNPNVISQLWNDFAPVLGSASSVRGPNLGERPCGGEPVRDGVVQRQI